MDILTYINKMNRLYGSEPLAASIKPKPGWQHAPWQDYPQDDDIPSVQKRALLKPGGLVEPGVTHYATNIGDPLPKKIQNFLIDTFDDVEFDWSKGRYGVSKKDASALHTKISRVANIKINDPSYVYTPLKEDVSKLKYEKGWGTGKQLLEKAELKGINAKEGRAASIFADNFNIKSKANPFKKQDNIYDLTVLDDSKKVEKIIKKQVRTPIIIDGRNFFSKSKLEELGFTYSAIGKP